MLTVIIFLIVLGILIFVHELGHFLLAKWNGIRVDEFKIGFGPRIISWKKGETQYGLNAIPFGGYVKIHGENPDTDSISGPDKARSFVHKNRWQQVSVLAAGVIFNFIFAWILYVIVFSSGFAAAKDDFSKYADRFTNERIMVTYVNEGSPAQEAGIAPGDVIVGTDVQDSDLSITEIQNAINSSDGKSVALEVLRGEKRLPLQVTPIAGIVEGKYAIGIAMSEAVDVRLPFFTAIYEGGRYTLIMIRETTVGLYHFFTGVSRGTANFSDVTGPIGIAGIVGDAAGMGFTYLLMITALISINLGVINFIPFPALDGGRILFVGIEGIIRRPIKPVISNTINAVGFVLLMILMVVVTYKDIARMIQ